MARDWSSLFQTWSKPPSETEQTKCENAERMVRRAIQDSKELAGHQIQVFAQGSYRNNTNVREDSDVDICVRYMDTIFYSLPDGYGKEAFGLQDSTYSYARYKDEIERALRSFFDNAEVRRGNKAFDIHANTYRVDADVVACFEHRRYVVKDGGSYYYLSGTELRPDTGERVINWPHQHYESGVNKNNSTGDRFKKVVRALKHLRNEMVDQGVQMAQPIPSYLVECLVWNVPNQHFGHSEIIEDIRESLRYLYHNTKSLDPCKSFVEVNQLKWLFGSGQPWTFERANTFLLSAWHYAEFK